MVKTRHRTLGALSSVLAGIALAWSCAGDKGTTTAPTTEPARPTTVAVTPAAAELTALGATVQLTAQVRDQRGQVMAAVIVSWTSGNASVATVDGSGLVTAAGVGTATITATANSISAQAVVTVVQKVHGVAISPAAATLVAGDTVRLVAEATDANGYAVAGAEFSWVSGDTAVAMVDGTGLVTGMATGDTEITAISAGVTDHVEIAVLAPEPATVSVTPDTVSLTAIGQSVGLSAEVRDQIGRAMSGEPVTWASSDTLVATVDSAGLVTAVGGGATTVAATASDVSGEAVVTVMQSAGSLTVSPTADTIAPSDTLRLVAEAFDDNGHAVEGAVFTWSSSDASVATVDASGLVRGVRAGAATITAASGSAWGTSEITVENPDRAALVAFYNATDGPNWKRDDNWLTDAPLREWYGIGWEWHGGEERVERLLLYDNNLTGPIPDAISRLDRITTLHLDGNNLTGPIPTALTELDRLATLGLPRNDLTGPIPPELGNLANLKALALDNNNLTGSIPPELGNMRELSDLFLHFNQLEGEIPASLGNLRNARIFDLGFNRLSGPFPSELASLELEGLWVGGQPDLCAPDDPVLRSWLVSLDAHLYPCPVHSEHTPLPRVILREDGNGVSLRLPYSGGEEVVVKVSDSTVVYASTSFISDPDDPEVSGSWLDLAPAGKRGDADVTVTPSSDDLESFASRVTVRQAVGTLGVDVVMGIPHPVGHEETMMEVVEWWEYMLDGSEMPDRLAVTCVLRDEYARPTVKAVTEDFLLVTKFHPTREGGAAVGGPCDERFLAGIPPSNGGVEPFGNGGGTLIIPVLRHEMGHAFGLAGLVEPSHPGLLKVRDGVRYFTGSNATRAYRAAGGDPDSPGVPLDGPHWPVPDMVVGLDVHCLPYESRPNAISMYALIDMGYVVHKSKIVPLKGTTVAEYCGGE